MLRSSGRIKLSIRFIVTVLLLIILLIQVGTFASLFINLEVKKKLEENTFHYIADKAEEAKYDLEEFLVGRVSNFDNLSELKTAVRKKYRAHLEGRDDFAIDRDTAELILEMIYNTYASGGFLILDDNPDEIEAKTCVYFKDINPATKKSDHSDIMMEYGDHKIAREFNIALDVNWAPYLNTEDEESRKIYRKMNEININSRKNYPSLSESIGYFTEPLSLLLGERKNVYYIYPLIDDYTDKQFGLIGIEIDDEIFKTLTDHMKLSASPDSGCMILKRNANANGETDTFTYSVVSVSNPILKRFIKNDTAILKRKINEYYNENIDKRGNEHIYELYTEGESNNLLGIKKVLNLYDKNSVRSSEEWVLMTLVNRDEFTVYSKTILKSFRLIFIVTIASCLIMSFLASGILTGPLKKLIREIKSAKLGEEIKLKRINVSEVDDIMETVEVLSRNVKNTASRMQRVIEMSNISLLTLEENPDDNIAYKSGKLNNYLDEYIFDRMEYSMPYSEYIDIKNQFHAECDIVKSGTYTDSAFSETVLSFIKDGREIYIKTLIKIHEDVTLITMMDCTDEILTERKNAYLRDYDVLTNLLNRNGFKKHTVNLINSNPDLKAVMVMWDLDNLKFVNDTYGHDCGDRYLKEASKIISMLKTEKSFISRVSGDEFFAFIAYESDKHDVLKKLFNVQNMLTKSKLYTKAGDFVSIRATAGISWYPEDGTSFDELVKYSDFAMYSAKKSEKGSMYEFNRYLYDRDYILLSGKEALSRFLEYKEVDFAMQPIVSASTGEIYAYEALMRPTSPDIKTVFDVMRIARNQSVLNSIEILTWTGVLEKVDRHKELFNNRKIFINSIANTALPTDLIEEISETYKELLTKIVIEIIESEQSDEKSMDIKKQIKDVWKCEIAVDDFGTGYANESSLLSIKPDYIKIDMSIVRDIDNDENRQLLVSNIIAYTRKLNIKTIAEGVETKSEMKTLKKLGIDLLQGYYIGRPNVEIVDVDPDIKKEIASKR